MPTEMSLKEAMGDTGDGPHRTRIEAERSRDGKPDGVIFGVPELEDATDEEKHAFLKRLILNPEEVIPRARKGPVFGAAPAPAPSLPVERPAPEPQAAAGDDFDADRDLYDPDSYRVERVTLSGGKKVWVHPTSFEERLEIGQRVLADLKRGGYFEAPETREEAATRELQWKQAMVSFTQLYQTLRCARQGPEPGAAPVFQEKHLDALKRNPGWGEAIERIAGLSDRLSEGATEAGLLKGLLADFFGRLQSVAEISCSKLKTPYSAEAPMPGPVSEVHDLLEDFAYSVSRLRRPGKPFEAEHVQAAAMVLGYAEE